MNDTSSEKLSGSALEPTHSEGEAEVIENVDQLKRRLGNRQIQLIAIGGSIGTGLFINIGIGLAKAGPAGLLLALIVYPGFMAMVNNCMAEMAVLMPVSGGFIRMGGKWVDDALGFMAGWNFFLYEALTVPFEITALNIVLTYWRDDIPPAAVITAVLVVYCLLNVLAVGVYGEAEFWLSGGKVLLVFILFGFTFFTMVGLNPERDAYGFRYWSNPGPFAEWHTSGDLGRFEGFLGALWAASIIVVGPEYLSMAAAEAKLPRIYLKDAYKTVYWRFGVFFIGGALCVGIVVPYNDPVLRGVLAGTSEAAGTATASPYVIAMKNLGIGVLPHITNALIFTSIFSAGNTYLYCAIRSLYGLALEGRAPRIFTKCARNGVPLYCVVASMMFPLLSYLQLSSGSTVVLQWFINLITGGAIINFLVIYPGCACDTPSHAYQLSFESWTDWSSFYATAPEILEYWKRVADKYDVRKHVRLQHKCLEASWDESRSKWTAKFLRSDRDPPTIVEDEADVLITGTGFLNEWEWPSIKGLSEFKGDLIHTANWEDGFDPTGKSVAVIGAGSSGIQVVPAIVSKVKSMDHHIRGRTWIANQLSGDLLKERVPDDGSTNFQYLAEEQEAWRTNRAAYIEYRKALEVRLQGNQEASRLDSPRHVVTRTQFEKTMRARLAAKPELAEHLIPDFPPFCKRLTPGPGYLEALTAPNVNVITEAISSVDATGITTNDGVKHPVDAIICATGFDTSLGSGFPIYGRDGINLRQKYAVRPKSYLGLCTDNFPNFFQSLGPNSFQGAGSLLISLEQAHLYMAQVLRRLAYGNVKTIEPKRKQVENFTNFCDEYFKNTVYSAGCVSWYKVARPGASVEEQKNARITALWPGSSVHAVKALESVRWEDYEMETVDDNDLGWLGNGWALGDQKVGQDNNVEPLTWYLNNTKFLHEHLEPECRASVLENESVLSKVNAEYREEVDTKPGTNGNCVRDESRREGE